MSYKILIIGKRNLRYYWWGEYDKMEDALRAFKRLELEYAHIRLEYYTLRVIDEWVGGLLPSEKVVLYLNRRLRL